MNQCAAMESIATKVPRECVCYYGEHSYKDVSLKVNPEGLSQRKDGMRESGCAEFVRHWVAAVGTYHVHSLMICARVWYTPQELHVQAGQEAPDGILIWEHDRGLRALRAHCATRSFDLNRERNGPLL